MELILCAIGIVAASPWAIVPGRGIGHVRIGEPEQRVFRDLGKSDPALGDAAMGHFWAGWKSGSHRLAVYSVRGEANVPHVEIVHVDSPRFATTNGIRVGASWPQVRRAFVNLTRVPNHDQTVPGLEIWDDVQRGIAFDFQAGRCVGIAVHTTGKPIGSEYLAYGSEVAAAFRSQAHAK